MTGAIFGLIFTAVNFVDYVSEDNAHSLCIVIVLLSFLLGTLFGIVLLTLPKLGYVNIGIWVATIFSLLLQNSVLYRTGSMLGFYITFGVSALLMTAVALLALRYFIILSTAFVSAFWLVRPLGFFLDYYPNEFETARLQTINSNTPWQFYLYLLSIIVLTLLGSVCQFCLYRKKGAGNGGHGYYLEEEGTLKEKLEKLLEFK